MIVAEYIARYLQKIGITHVFGYDGSMMLKIADEIPISPSSRRQIHSGFLICFTSTIPRLNNPMRIKFESFDHCIFSI